MIVGYGIILGLVLLALAGITLEKAYFYLPARELERRAGKGDWVARSLALVASYGDELRLVLVVFSWAAAAVGCFLLVRLAPPAIGLGGVFIALLLLFFWQLRSPLTAKGALLAAWCAAPLAWLMVRLQPVLRSPATLFRRFHLQRKHTGLYERADFIEFLGRQAKQRDNRIRPAELEQMERILASRSRTVAELMTPRAQVRAVNANEQISPVLQNELHQSGHGAFPVYEGAKTNIVGVLKLRDIADVKQHGTVAEAMSTQLTYLHKTDTIEQLIKARFQTRQSFYVVLDDHGKYSGIVTLDAVLEYLFGTLNDVRSSADKVVAKDVTEVVE